MTRRARAARRPTVIVALLLCTRVLAAEPATTPATQPQDDPTAKQVEQLATEAMAAYQGADYKRSYALFERAYELRQVGALLYNMAKAQDKLGNVGKALELYRRYRDSSDADQNLMQKVLLRIKALEAAEKLARQSAEAARTPPDLADDSMAPLSRRAFSKAEAAARALRRRERIAAWSLFGAAIAGGATAIGLGSAALSVRNEALETAKPEAAQDDLLQRNRRYAAWADGMTAFAAASLVASGTLLYLGYRERAPAKTAMVRVVPVFAPGGAMMVAGGTF